MIASWHRLCRATDLHVDDSHVQVKFANGRHHVITVEENDDAYRFTGIIARPSIASGRADLALRAWIKNRATQLAGFMFDARERLVGETCLPKVGATAEEFQICIRTLAAECDRFEYLLTGKDNE
jgi:hypothetical protein